MRKNSGRQPCLVRLKNKTEAHQPGQAHVVADHTLSTSLFLDSVWRNVALVVARPTPSSPVLHSRRSPNSCPRPGILACNRHSHHTPEPAKALRRV